MTLSHARDAWANGFGPDHLFLHHVWVALQFQVFDATNHHLQIHYWYPCHASPSRAPRNLYTRSSSSSSSFLSDVLGTQQLLLCPFLKPSAHPKLTLAPLDRAEVWFSSYGPCFSHCKLSSPSVSTLPASYIRGHIHVSSPAQAFIKQTLCERPSGQEVHPEPCPLGGSGTVSGSWLPERLSSALSGFVCSLQDQGRHVMFSAP